MIIDKNAQFSDAQAITASAASTNVVDLGGLRDLGTGNNLFLMVTCIEAMADSGSDATVKVDIQTDDDEAFGSATTAEESAVTFPAVSAAGTVKYARLRPGAIDERYMQLYYNVANGPLTAGKFTAAIVNDIQKTTPYPSGYEIKP